jgi:hypothetical protein
VHRLRFLEKRRRKAGRGQAGDLEQLTHLRRSGQAIKLPGQLFGLIGARGG